jgi:hypothetical protein
MEGTDLRKETRYRLGAPALFSWEGANRKRFQGEGVTRDISVQGAFIFTLISPPVDCPIQLDLLLPPISGLSNIIRITGRARVIRAENRSGGVAANGFAVVTHDLSQWGLGSIRADSGPAAPEEVVSLELDSD